jgi:hypothetical protein
MFCALIAVCFAVGNTQKKTRELEDILKATDVELFDLKQKLNKETSSKIWDHDN